MSQTRGLTVYPKGVLLETLRRRIIALQDEGYNDDFLRAIREAHKALERREKLLRWIRANTDVSALDEIDDRIDAEIGAPETVAAGSASDPLTTPEAIKGNAPDPLIAQPSAPVCSFCGMPDCDYFDGECVEGTVSAGQESR